MKPRTAWGNKLLAASWWDTGMRGHFTRLSNTTGPEDMEFAIRAIEDEARAAERARIRAAVKGGISGSSVNARTTMNALPTATSTTRT